MGRFKCEIETKDDVRRFNIHTVQVCPSALARMRRLERVSIADHVASMTQGQVVLIRWPSDEVQVSKELGHQSKTCQFQWLTPFSCTSSSCHCSTLPAVKFPSPPNSFGLGPLHSDGVVMTIQQTRHWHLPQPPDYKLTHQGSLRFFFFLLLLSFFMLFLSFLDWFCLPWIPSPSPPSSACTGRATASDFN